MKLFNQLDKYLAKLPSFGSGGGGSSSGQVSYPPYMQACHGDLLDNLGNDLPNTSVIEVMNTAFGNSPYTGEVAYDPATEVASILAAPTNLGTLVALLSAGTGLDALVSSILDTGRIATAISNFDNVIDNIAIAHSAEIVNVIDAEVNAEINAVIHQNSVALVNAVAVNQIPKFEAGMRDIGAVVSSAFPIGKSIIDKAVVDQTAKIIAEIDLQANMHNQDVAMRSNAHNRDVTLQTGKYLGELRLQQAKFAADMHIKMFNESALAVIQLKLQYQYQLSTLTVEANRMKIVANKEENDTNLKILEADATWDLEVFKYGSNVLGSISGSAVNQGTKTGSSGSALGGALSGAASGAAGGFMVGGPWGAVIGGVIGAASGLLSNK